MRLRATGILAKLQNDAMSPPLANPKPRVRVDQPLSLSQLATLFIIHGWAKKWSPGCEKVLAKL